MFFFRRPPGLPAYLQRRLQSVLNAAARVIVETSCHDHVLDALETLHWLRLPQRVDIKVAVMCAAWCRSIILFVSPTCPVVADFARHHHINCLFHHSGSQPSVDAYFQSLHQSSGTHCYLISNHPRLYTSSVNV